jgi:hypothetical protein
MTKRKLSGRMKTLGGVVKRVWGGDDEECVGMNDEESVGMSTEERVWVGDESCRRDSEVSVGLNGDGS